jgi:hypothetical protein
VGEFPPEDQPGRARSRSGLRKQGVPTPSSIVPIYA